MRLADFIDANAQAILEAAETFAATLLPAATHLDQEALRDHMPLLLTAITADLRTLQTAEEELRKSSGQAPLVAGAPKTAAQTHALLRAQGGFYVEQLVAEYRALRAGVLRLWRSAEHSLDAEAFADMVRFNEAIDQAVAESVAVFTAEVERWRHLFLGVLGHDLRSPLNAIMLTSELLSRLASDAPVAKHTQNLIRSGERMKALLDDLLDYSRGSLGLGMTIRRVPVDLAAACAEEVELLRAALPGRSIGYRAEGPTQGDFDASRVREALGNLVSNAAKYGSQDGRIEVRLVGGSGAVKLSVANEGEPMAAETLQALFEPLRRGAVESSEDTAGRTSLGLGLFIVREITRAHGGQVDVVCEDGRTVFSLTLLGGTHGSRAAS